VYICGVCVRVCVRRLYVCLVCVLCLCVFLCVILQPLILWFLVFSWKVMLLTVFRVAFCYNFDACRTTSYLPSRITIHTHVYTHLYTHKRNHINSQAGHTIKYKRINTYKHTQTHTNTRKRRNTHTNTHKRTHLHTRTRTKAHKHTRTHMHA